MPEPAPHPIDMKTMIEAAIDPILLLTTGGRIIHANRAFEALLDRTREEVVDRWLGSLLSESSARAMSSSLEAISNTIQGLRLDVVGYHADGREIDLDIILVPVILFSLPSHSPTDVFAILRDITGQKRAQAQQRALIHGLRTVLASAAELMACPDLDSTYRRAVEFTREELGIERSALFLVDSQGRMSGTYGTDMQGRTTNEYKNGFQMWDIIPAEWTQINSAQEAHWTTFDDIWYDWDGEKSVPAGRGWNTLSPVHSTEGLIGIVSNDAAISGAPLDEIKQEVLSVFCSLLGKIIERKRYEDTIHQALEKEHDLADLKSRLIQSVSHEFRTPFAVILTSAHVLRHYGTRISEERANVHWNAIEQQVEHMTSLLEELLTIEKMDRQHSGFEPTPLDLVAFCSSLAQRFSIRAAPAHQIVFSWQGDHPIRLADEWLLNQILTNLLSNAIAYSPQGDAIQLELDCSDDAVRLRVVDHGIGISPEDQAHIFDLFHRGRNVETIHGIGLGLSIVQRAVMAHEGTITFESQLGVGTSFTVTLPVPRLE